jgi:phosphatidylserine/phosphatidylglycerophosphate/cardiolipin synthase-like enzyme
VITEAIRRLREWASTWQRRALLAAAGLVVVAAGVGWYESVKPLPADLVLVGAPVLVAGSDLRLLIDLTSRDLDDRAVYEQAIFDRVLELVAGARRLLVLDLFLLNDHLGPDGSCHRPLSSQVTEALLAARQRVPDMPIVLITDPINDLYGGDPSDQLATLREAGVQVVTTDLVRLRDSNPLYSALWRLAFSWWGNTAGGGWLPNPLDARGRTVGVRTYLRMANFKANHRKVVLADNGPRWHTVVTSANPHDASSAHSNVALEVASRGLAAEVYRAEMEVLRLSGGTPPLPDLPDIGDSAEGGSHRVSYLTESAIRDRVLDLVEGAGPGDEIDLAMFYLSHRRVLGALLDAARRGVWLRVVLDPNRDAFGHAKSGIPNRQSAGFLVRESGGAVAVRWYATHGEQFHTKLLVVRHEHTVDAVLGSANFTRRNLDDYNLEASVWLSAPRGSDLDRELRRYVDRIWTNDDGVCTLPYAAFRDPSRTRQLIAWLQERTGVGTF